MVDEGSVALTTSDTLATRERAFNLPMKMGFQKLCFCVYEGSANQSDPDGRRVDQGGDAVSSSKVGLQKGRRLNSLKIRVGINCEGSGR